MSFVNGLKIFFKKPIYILILALFIGTWILILFGYTLFTIPGYYRFLFFFVGILAGFTTLLIVISLFKPIEKMSYIIIFIVFLISIPTIIIFKGVLQFFYFLCLIGNQILTAFFAFKLCMDSSTKVDDYFYIKEKSRKFTRPIEFIIFGLITLSTFIITWNLLGKLTPIAAERSVRIFRTIFWVDIILIIIVISRVFITKKFAAYITLFFLLTFFYILYIIIDTIAEFIFPDTVDYITWYFFIIDLSLFIYIIGSIFDKVEYLEQKFKIFGAETISLFVILMKLTAQCVKIIPDIPGIDMTPAYLLRLQIFLLWLFIIFILIFGFHSLIVHKEGKKESDDLED